MSELKLPQIYNAFERFYTGSLTRQQLDDTFQQLGSESFNHFLASCLLNNELDFEAIEEKLGSESARERRRSLLHMRGLK